MKIVFTASVMDCLHEGHVNLLKEMRKEAGENGMVGVILHDDKSTFENKKRFPIQSVKHRFDNLLKSDLVDVMIITKDANPSYDFIKFVDFAKQNIDEKEVKFIYMRGNDWVDFPGRAMIEALNIPIKFVKYTKGVSTTAIRKKITKK